VTAFAPKRRAKQGGVGSGSPHGEKDEGGDPVWAAPHRGRRRMGPSVPVAVRERRRRVLVRRCPAPCRSRGEGGTRGLSVGGRKELGRAREQ
jgi:hypothetical protein